MAARILLILPHQVDRLLYEEAVPALGFEAVSSTGVSDALKLIEQAPPDLVILDEQVQMTDGSDPILAIRRACWAPIVLSVWSSSDRGRLIALRRGADDALPKPLERVALATTLCCLYQVKRRMDRGREREAELASRLRVLCDRAEKTVRSLRSSLSSAVLGVAYVQEILESQEGVGLVHHALSDASTALDGATEALEALTVAVRTDRLTRDLELENVDLTELIGQVGLSRRPLAQARQIELGVQVPQGLELDADRDVLTRVTHQLVDESLRQTGAGGRVLLWARPDADQVEIAVRCSGAPSAPSPSDGERPTLPVREVPEPRESGLEFCRQAVLAHGGSMRVERDPDWLLSYVVRLPRQGPMSLRPGKAGSGRQ